MNIKRTKRAAVSTALVMLTAMSAHAGTRIKNHARKGSGFVVDARRWPPPTRVRAMCVVRVESGPTRLLELPPPTVASVLLRSLEPPRIDHPRSHDEEALGAAVAICVDAIAALSFALPMMFHRMFGDVDAPHGLTPSQASAGDVL